MDCSIATLLSFFSEDKLVAGKFLEKKLGCENESDEQTLQLILDVLERLGILVKERGKYRRTYPEQVVEAKLRCSSKGFCFAIQDDEDAEDIYVRETNLSNAWNGDRVLVKIIKDGTRRRSPEGEVHLILERANPSLLAQVKKSEQGFKAVPLDDRLLFELHLQENGVELNQVIDHLVHVAVLRYALGEQPPLGKVTKVLGSDAEAAADTDIVSCKHDLPLNWSEEALAQAQTLSPALPDDQRQDLRSLLTFTFVDDSEPLPQDALSFLQTAFSLEKRENLWRLALHITDVAHYIPVDTPLDRAAKKRGTAIFLGDKSCPLFPDDVAQRCSFVPGEDRLALSFFLTLESNGQVVGFEYQPSVIRVDQQFSLPTVQTLLSEPEQMPEALAPYAESLHQLFFSLSPLAKAQRLQRGSFSIQSDTPTPFLDEGRLGVIFVKEALPVRALLTELTVLVSKAIADHLKALEVPAIYCGQQPPDWEDLTEIVKLANNLGLEFTPDTEQDVTSQDFYRISQVFGKAPGVKVLNHLLENTLKTTKYSTHPAPHFGLAYELYTHCVAPGQRYADLLVQRVLKAVLAEGRDRRTKQTKIGVDLASSDCYGQITWNVLPPNLQEFFQEEFHHLVALLNDREKVAEDAEKDLLGLKKAETMKAHTGQIFRGLITGVQSYGFFVEIADMLAEGLVHVSSLKDDWYEYRARHSCLVGRKNRTAYRLGNEVEVQIKSVDYYRQQIDLVTVGGGAAINTEDWEEEEVTES